MVLEPRLGAHDSCVGGRAIRPRGCRPRTASFKYRGLYAVLQNVAPGLGTERHGDLQRHLRIRAPGCSRTRMPWCTVCSARTARAAPSQMQETSPPKQQGQAKAALAMIL
uniref:Uncharacterized protein n=1 Tax=Eutreptiella gymnastica TaxID=73025 RepID=A0A7S4GD98_9EUGL